MLTSFAIYNFICYYATCALFSTFIFNFSIKKSHADNTTGYFAHGTPTQE